MSEHDSAVANPASEPRDAGSRRRTIYVAVAIVGVAVVGGFASSSFSQALRHRLVNVPDRTLAASFDGRFGPGSGPPSPFGLDWRSGLMNGAIEAIVDAHADRMIRHLAVEIDATAEQQDKLQSIVHAAVKDLLPVREKVEAAKTTARELLTQQTIDRAALEKLRADQIALHDAASRRLIQAIADAAETLSPEQRRKISNMAPRGGGGGGLIWGRGPGGGNWGGFWRN
jgi:Spy/CpxP family protein refolding chaperone